MIKKKIISIIFTFQFFVFLSCFSNICDANTLKILDSTQVELKTINSISAKPSTGGGEIPLGTIINWFHDYDPQDNNCTSAKAGGNGNGGKCKWLECNGQVVNKSIYTEYFSDKTPNYQNLITMGKGKRIANKPYINFLYLTDYYSPLEALNKHLHYDGLIDIRFSDMYGSNSIASYRNNTEHYFDLNGNGRVDTEEKTKDNRLHYLPVPYSEYETKIWSSKSVVDTLSVRYLIRVSN